VRALAAGRARVHGDARRARALECRHSAHAAPKP
jgi:Cdc6-like AAA superfamily ATPase